MITVRKICLLFLLVYAGLAIAQDAVPEKRIKEAQNELGKLNVSRFEQMFQTGKFDFKPLKLDHTVMHYAAFMGDLDRVKLLAEKGGDINVEGCNKKTPLHFAALSGNMELVQWLVQQDADLNAITSYDETALHFAAQSGNLELVQWLVEQGLDINAKESYDNETALYYAVKNGNFEMVMWLVEHGARIYPDESQSDKDSNEESDDVFGDSDSSDRQEAIRDLLDLAVDAGNLKLVQWLIEQGANIEDIKLYYAAKSGSLELVQWLHEKGLDIISELNDAAQSGNLELVQWMADHGADLMTEDSTGNALTNAAFSGNLELVQWLADKGVPITDRSLVYAAQSDIWIWLNGWFSKALTFMLQTVLEGRPCYLLFVMEI